MFERLFTHSAERGEDQPDVTWVEMIRFGAIFLLVLALACGSVHKPRRSQSRGTPLSGPVTTLEDVSVIDVASGRAMAHQDIVIRGANIAAVRDSSRRRTDIRYVIPGLWDMHVHLWFPRSQMQLYIANGVTGVRDMGTDLRRVRAWQKEIAAGERVGPRIYACGSPVSTVASDVEDMPVNVISSPQEARAIFNRYYDQRVDFIKVLNLSPAAFEALAEVSRHDGIPFAGHLPWGVSAFVAAQDRMVSMEHLFGIGLACSRKENELRNRGMGAREQHDGAAIRAVDDEVARTYDATGGSVLWDTFRRYDVFQTPTLALWERMLAEPSERPDTIRYVDASLREKWTAPRAETDRTQYNFAFRLTGDMAKAGVGILAGTDTGDPWTVPGFELHHELALLVKAGLTPAQALRASTMEPARLMHRERELGQVKAGFAADLVILRANPLTDIGNTHAIDSVVVRGRLFDKEALTKMLNDVAASAKKS